MELYDLKVNHLTNPLGFHMDRTVFTWKVRDAVGTKQEAARMEIFQGNADFTLDESAAPLIDTGFSQEADSLGWRLELPLKPYTRYYWRLTVKTDAGETVSGEMQWFETGKMNDPWAGQWITCDSTTRRHPYMEKHISLKKAVKAARLYICGLGLYEAYYNGEKLGNEFLTPYSNNYNQWVQYQTYDVIQQLKTDGTLSVLLGNGWYKGRFGFAAREERGFYGNEWKLMAELRILYEDGTEAVIGTDESWTVRRSNLIFSNIYDGEQRDDTLKEAPAENVSLCEAPKGALTARFSLPVTIHERLTPVELIHTPAGEQVLDLGQEIAGIFSLRIREKAGTRIHIQTGEVLQNGNFYNGNLRSARSEYIYISDGSETELIPHFTYYGYRYVKITGVTDLKKEDFTALVFYSDIEDAGSIETGNALVNKLVSNVRWGMKGNFIDVPTDCPQRDERMGWTGDTQVFSPTATYLADTYAFYRKYLYDMASEQRDFDGKVPDVIPSCGVDSCACVWGDAATIIPWNLYMFYGDQSILEDQFDSMKAWVDYIRRVDGNDHGWRHVFHYGDWLALDNPNGGVDEVLGGTDEEFIANIYYAVSAGIVAKAAKILGKTAAAAEYAALSDEQFAEVKKEYYSATGRCCIKTQTALLLTLKYHLSENEPLIKAQLKKLFEDNNYKLKTGFVGTPLLANVLSDFGFGDLSYKLLLNEQYPGWLHEIKLGATTVWERWNSLDENGQVSSTGMNSLNHYSYGSIVEWMFSHAAGIRPLENGFRTAYICPELNGKIGYVSAVYDSPAGTYKSSWLLESDKAELAFEVPFGCQAKIRLPLAPASVYENADNPLFAHVDDGVCTVGAGCYKVTYTLDKSLKKSYGIDCVSIRELQSEPEIVEALKEIIPLDQVPSQYSGYTIKETAALFPGVASEERLQKAQRVLEKF